MKVRYVMECFTVQSKDLLDKGKNPNLSLSARDVLDNPSITKTPIVLIPKVSVWNMTGRSGREVPNQFIIETSDGRYFQSYNTIIACYFGGKTYLDKDNWDYSTTTGRYRNQFLGDDSINETRKKIKSGEYILTDLN